MLKLYFSPGACSLAPHILLEEIGQPYEVQKVDLKTGEQRSPEYAKVNWKGKVPALQLDDGQILTENVAILPYLAERHPERGLIATDVLGRARAFEWLGWCASTVHASFWPVFRPTNYCDEEAAPRVKAIALETLQRHFDKIDELLRGRSHPLGDRFGVGDPYLVVFYRWGKAYDLKIGDDYRRVVAELAGRPSVMRAIEAERIKIDLSA
jgi:glutathione S-transferase